jgi:endogenous inhibitor of DNA gyrase (YacG/DUF329 family)
MARRYERNCDHCGRRYKGQGMKYCSWRCSGRAHTGPKNAKWKPGRKCELCGAPVSKKQTNARFCSRKCYRQSPDGAQEQARRNGAITAARHQKASNQQLLAAVEQIEAGKASARSIFRQIGYARPPYKRLKRMLSQDRLARLAPKGRKMGGRNYMRGVWYERKAMRELRKQGSLVVRSAGSGGAFDLWAVGPDRLRLIQVKAVKNGARVPSSVVDMLADIDLPGFCQKELWVWHDRQGWEKSLID